MNEFVNLFFSLDSEWTNKIFFACAWQQCLFWFISVWGYLGDTGKLRYVACRFWLYRAGKYVL